MLQLRGFLHRLRIELALTLLALKALKGPIGKAIEKKHGLERAKHFMRESERLAVAVIAERDIQCCCANPVVAPRPGFTGHNEQRI